MIPYLVLLLRSMFSCWVTATYPVLSSPRLAPFPPTLSQTEEETFRVMVRPELAVQPRWPSETVSMTWDPTLPETTLQGARTLPQRLRPVPRVQLTLNLNLLGLLVGTIGVVLIILVPLAGTL